MTERHIIPFGGMRHDGWRVHPIIDYVLQVTGKPQARVCIISTATGDDSVDRYREWLPAERTWSTDAFIGRQDTG